MIRGCVREFLDPNYWGAEIRIQHPGRYQHASDSQRGSRRGLLVGAPAFSQARISSASASTAICRSSGVIGTVSIRSTTGRTAGRRRSPVNVAVSTLSAGSLFAAPAPSSSEPCAVRSSRLPVDGHRCARDAAPPTVRRTPRHTGDDTRRPRLVPRWRCTSKRPRQRMSARRPRPRPPGALKRRRTPVRVSLVTSITSLLARVP
jgi:hypothetical protein